MTLVFLCCVGFFIVNVANTVLGDLVAPSSEVYSFPIAVKVFLHRLVKES